MNRCSYRAIYQAMNMKFIAVAYAFVAITVAVSQSFAGEDVDLPDRMPGPSTVIASNGSATYSAAAYTSITVLRRSGVARLP